MANFNLEPKSVCVAQSENLGSKRTNSSEAVECAATELSKSYLVAPIWMATEMPCIISSMPLPIP